jgi:hypothetical protein
MKKLAEDTPCIDIGDIKSILAGDKGNYKLEIIISDKYVEVIDVASTVGNFGGHVYWFVCPGCKRRVKKIYLSSENNVFLCRNCLGLAYRSKNIRDFRKTGYLRKIKKADDLKNIIKRREEVVRKLVNSIRRFK